jgi:hypothetical protein
VPLQWHGSNRQVGWKLLFGLVVKPKDMGCFDCAGSSFGRSRSAQHDRAMQELVRDNSVRFGIFRFSGLAWGWNYDGGKIAFCSQFPEGWQITELQIIPAAE